MKIQEKFYDALFFASSTLNEKQDFFLRPAEFKVMLKLIHYSTKDKYITWSSENISKHISATIGSVDKAIQRLKQKGYITVWTEQRGKTERKRTIQINWEKIEAIDALYNTNDLNQVFEESTPTITEEEKIQPEISKEEIDLSIGSFQVIEEDDDLEIKVKDEVKNESNLEKVFLHNGIQVVIKPEYAEGWAKVQNHIGFIKRLKSNISQIGFDLDLNDYLKEKVYI